MSSIALNKNRVEFVSINNGEAKTTSLAVAQKFGKRHANVLQAIENIECSDAFRELNFKLVMESMTYVDKDGIDRTKQTKRIGHVEMTKDGFTFLVRAVATVAAFIVVNNRRKKAPHFCEANSGAS